MHFSVAFGNHRRWLGIAIVLALAAAGAQRAWTDPAAPRPADRHIALMVSTLLPSEHLSRHPLDGEMSKRMLELFLGELDPMKMYFYQADVDAFRLRQDELVEKVKRGDVSPAYAIFAVFLQRMDERVKTVDELLPIPPDFTVKEDMVVDHKAALYATTADEAREKWRKRLKYDLLMLKVEKKTDAENAAEKSEPGKPQIEKPVEKPKSTKVEGEAAREKLARRYHSLAKRTHQTDGEELLEMYLTAMTTAYDPHTSYMAPKSQDNFNIMMRLDLEGIGASLQSEDGYTVVKHIVPGGAAAKDGRIKLEDKITAVSQGPGTEPVDVIDMKLADVVQLIRGKRGTVVGLKVITAKSGETTTYYITRERIELKDSEAQSRIFDVARQPGFPACKVGVIDLPSFYMDMDGARLGLQDYRSTTRDVRRILEEFTAKGVDAVILDLRYNGGGALTEAINLTGLFVGRGPVVQVKGSDAHVQVYDDEEPGVAWNGPLVVLTSKLSASASEIFAAAIQDYHRGLIVGDHTTHGKGTVQSMIDLGQKLFRLPNSPSLGALKITVQQFYRPNGDSTQQRGVLADVELPHVTTYMDIGESDLEYSLPFDRVDPSPFRSFNYVDKLLAAELASRSTKRCSTSDDFKKEQRNIAHYLDRKQQKRVTLNEKDFMAERAEFSLDEEEKKLDNQDKSPIKRDYYMNESLAVTRDYLELLAARGQAKLAGPQQISPQPAATP